MSPLRRDQKRDFASGDGEALLRSSVINVLLTEVGELPWRTRFGAGLGRLRHRSSHTSSPSSVGGASAHEAAVLSELARVRVQEALARWLPHVTLLELHTEMRDSSLVITLRVRGSLGSGAPLETSVEISGQAVLQGEDT